MSNQVCIRQAVELADYFGLSDRGYDGTWIEFPDNTERLFQTHNGVIVVSHPYLERYWLDALAAQLVRQVDALDTPDTVEVTHNTVWVGYRSKNNESWKKTTGSDRTMNTIKAIVKSRVLPIGGRNPVVEEQKHVD